MKTSKETARYLFCCAGRYKAWILVMVILQGILGMAGILQALLLREAIDAITARNHFRFLFALAFMMGFYIIHNLGWRAVSYISELCRSSIENHMKERLFSVLLKKDYASVQKVHTGEWMNLLTSDVHVAAEGLVDLLPDLVQTLIELITVFVMILCIEYRFIYVLVPGGVFILSLTYVMRKRLKQYHKDIQEAGGRLTSFLQERLGSMLVIKAFQAEKQSAQGANVRMQTHKALRMRRSFFYNICSFGFVGVMDTLYLLGFAYGGYGILKGTVTYGTLMALLQLIGNIQSPFSNITGYLPRYYAMAGSAERLMAAEACPKESHGINVPQNIQDFYKKRFTDIECKNVSFVYSNTPETKVFDALNLTMRKGEIIAFTGESGCGKSTLFKLLLSLYPVRSGAIFVHGISEKKECWHLTADWRGMFAYVPQNHQLMTGTIREAVAFGSCDDAGAADISDQESRLWRALKIACADRFVAELSDGPDTELGERGAGLSEGQLQRLAIARAIYRDSPVLLLDEATSALDEATEACVLLNLKTLTDKLVLIVTHRPAALSICQRMICFNRDGRCTQMPIPFGKSFDDAYQ